MLTFPITEMDKSKIVCPWCLANGVPPFMATGPRWHEDRRWCPNRRIAGILDREAREKEAAALLERVATAETLAEARGLHLRALEGENARLVAELAAASAKVEVEAEVKVKVESP